MVGIGYVGLPLALTLARAGFRVVGLDISPVRVDSLMAGDPGIATVSAEELAAAVGSGRFQPTADPVRLSTCEAVIICVPSPLAADGSPDPSAIRAAGELVAAHVRPGVLVVLESTSYPGTTRELILPPLQRRLDCAPPCPAAPLMATGRLPYSFPGVWSPLDWHAALVAFGLIFLGELGDKTQLTTMMLATGGEGSTWPVFLGAAGALVLVALLSVLLGDAVQHLVPARTIHVAAGLLFLAVGGWLILSRA